MNGSDIKPAFNGRFALIMNLSMTIKIATDINPLIKGETTHEETIVMSVSTFNPFVPF